MNHQDALQEMSVERYLLGELAGQTREIFEEHLFDCPQCAADLKSGVVFLEGARAELAAPRAVPAAIPAIKVQRSASGRLLRMLSPAWLVPAVAACLLVIGYQSAVVIPSMHQQLADAERPAILNNVVLTGGVARGVGLPTVAAPAHGSFLLSVDIPSQDIYSSYLCSLYAPSGLQVWQGSITAEEAKDTVPIHIPSALTGKGENTLVIQGMRKGQPPGAKLDDLARDVFLLQLR